jgi:hypothetical protein
MSNRVLLNSSGLKVSQPGVDVLAAAPSQFQFNSDWSQIGLQQQGTITLNPNSDVSVSFAHSYPTPPVVIFDYPVGDGSWQPFGTGSFYYEQFDSGAGLPFSFLWIIALVATTGCRFVYHVDAEGHGYPSWPTVNLRYSVLAYNY